MHTAIGAPPLVDNNDARDFFGDGFAGFTMSNGNVYLTFTVLRADHSKTPPTHVRKVTSRLVLPLAAAMEMNNMLSQVFANMERQGLITKVPTPVSGAGPQRPVLQ